MLLVEAFSWAIRAARSAGLWRGISICEVPNSVSHWLFFDDTLLFGHASMSEAKVIKKIVMNYYAFSGQRVNTSKSKIFFLSTSSLV